MKFLQLCTIILVLAAKGIVVKCYCPSHGVLQLVQNNQVSITQRYSSGIVEVFDFNKWGNICTDSHFGSHEGDVICHQLGYRGVSEYGDAEKINIFGLDRRLTVAENVTCSSGNYLTLYQCTLSLESSGKQLQCDDDNKDLVVICYSDKIWDNPFIGQVRLSGGAYSNQGVLEVFCGYSWLTVAFRGFLHRDSNIVCIQLGYTGALDTGHLSLKPDPSFPVWYKDALLVGGICSNNINSTCFASCEKCPTNLTKNHLTYITAVTIECVHVDPESAVDYTDNYNTLSTCAYLDGGYINMTTQPPTDHHHSNSSDRNNTDETSGTGAYLDVTAQLPTSNSTDRNNTDGSDTDGTGGTGEVTILVVNIVLLVINSVIVAILMLLLCSRSIKRNKLKNIPQKILQYIKL